MRALLLLTAGCIGFQSIDEREQTLDPGAAESAPELRVDVAALMFGDVIVGGELLVSLLVHNDGDASEPPSYVVSGDSGFTIASATCESVFRRECEIFVRFRPVRLGPYQSNVEVIARNVRGESALNVGLSGNGALTGAGGNSGFSMPATLTVVKDGDGTGTVTGVDGAINCGATCEAVAGGMITLTASTTVTWAGCDSTDALTCTINLTANRTVTATFNLPRVALTIARDAQAPATGVISVDGTTCASPPCTYMLVAGSVTVTATPDVAATGTDQPYDYGFEGWSNALCDDESTTCTFTLDTPQTLTARFTPPNYAFLAGVVPNAITGITSFDAACQAASASLPPPANARTYKAWLGGAINAYTRWGTSPRGWLMHLGTSQGRSLVVAADQISRMYDTPGYNASGSNPYAGIITGAGADGSATADTCGNWTGTGDVTVGNPDFLSDKWTDDGEAMPCDATQRGVYCFGVDYHAPLTWPSAPTNAHRMFLTHNTYPAPTTGPTAFDTHCKTEAVAAGLCASVGACGFDALVATQTQSAMARVGFTADARPIYRIDGILVGASMTAMLSSSDWRGGVNYTSQGAFATEARVWAGASSYTSAGANPAFNCSDWTSNSSGTGTKSLADRRGFGDAMSFNCNTTARLFCLEH